MIINELFLTQESGREFPVTIYLPDDYKNSKKLQLVIFGNGFQGQTKFDQGCYTISNKKYRLESVN